MIDTQDSPDNAKPTTRPDEKHLNKIQNLLHLGICTAGEVSKLVAEMHATIASTPGLSLKVTPNPWTGHIHHTDAPLPYQIVNGSFYWLSRLLRPSATEKIDFRDSRWRRTRSILNGVAGDKLQKWHNQLAINMNLVNLRGQPLAIDRTSETLGRVIFLHGLCHSELDWCSKAHLHYAKELKTRGQQVMWLRYNSGLNIFRNGQDLAELLETQQLGDRPLTLIGHSMGGLLIRSACFYAEQREQQWLNSLTQAAYIGTPHLGAPLERIGHLANSLLGITPYAKPFKRLGNFRSQGIQDLRHGYISEEETKASDKKSSQPNRLYKAIHPSLPHLPGNTRHLLIASRLPLSEKLSRATGIEDENWLGDGLVPMKSALAEDHHHGLTLEAPFLQRVRLEDLGHINMLRSPKIYQILTRELIFDPPHKS
ncbi:esterase/lipase family protein [Hahella ganghwensis]|uniref:esterase/lipase family protein n=1 Tax=Hahella ganghwensis TaxID=286420 RepID=UPI00037F4726|nr:alpha/beta fold hydrolase [Hahella ganghwensis]